ncbi:MAG TPA: alpha/beta hydrolase [Pirellulales bacterium]|nr:alpha/beta hydrolase [Pirellulales bacterium]
MYRSRKGKQTKELCRFVLRAALVFLAALSGGRVCADDPPVADAPAVSEAPAVEVRSSVVYWEADDTSLTADIYLPAEPGQYPGVLLVHGGAWLAGSKGRMRHIARALAERGYVAVSINYRLAPKHKFPAQLDDCRTAVCWMRDNAADLKLDPARVGGFGYSAGAHLVTLMSLTAAQVCQSDAASDADRTAWEKCRLQAVVAGGTPCDFRALPPDNRYLAFWLGGTRAEKEELYRQASPMAFVTAAAPPVFLYHGEKDLLVLPHGPKALKQALDDAGVVTELVTLPDDGHIGTFMHPETLSKAYAFLDGHLRSPSPTRQAAKPLPADAGSR